MSDATDKTDIVFSRVCFAVVSEEGYLYGKSGGVNPTKPTRATTRRHLFHTRAQAENALNAATRDWNSACRVFPDMTGVTEDFFIAGSWRVQKVKVTAEAID